MPTGSAPSCSSLHEIVGDAAFGRIVGGYYRTHADGEGTSQAFVSFADGQTPVDLESFFRHWLFTTEWADALSQGASVADFVASYGREGEPGPAR
jgi:aminopeptidase N